MGNLTVDPVSRLNRNHLVLFAIEADPIFRGNISRGGSWQKYRAAGYGFLGRLTGSYPCALIGKIHPATKTHGWGVGILVDIHARKAFQGDFMMVCKIWGQHMRTPLHKSPEYSSSARASRQMPPEDTTSPELPFRVAEKPLTVKLVTPSGSSPWIPAF